MKLKNDESQKAPVAQPVVIDDPFDPAKLRIEHNFIDSVGILDTTTFIPVRKPHTQEFVRAHPSEEMRMPAAIIEFLGDRQSYLVIPSLVPALGKFVRPCLLVTAINTQDEVFLWKLKISNEGNSWNISHQAAADLAVKNWVQVTSNQAAGIYETSFSAAPLPEPKWPQLTFKEVLNIAFKGRLIDSLEHPTVRKLRGEIKWK